MSELFREGLRRLQREEEDRRPSAAALADLRSALQLIQKDARRAGLDKMSKREIKAEIEAARKEMHARVKRRAHRTSK
jgi:hypothetical protein